MIARINIYLHRFRPSNDIDNLPDAIISDLGCRSIQLRFDGWCFLANLNLFVEDLRKGAPRLTNLNQISGVGYGIIRKS